MFIATKVHDSNCEICQQMSRHDRALFEEFSEISYQEAALDDLINHGGNFTKLRIYQCLERYALNPDYTIDLPVYLVLTKEGKYKGHHTGAASITELRSKVKQILREES